MYSVISYSSIKERVPPNSKYLSRVDKTNLGVIAQDVVKVIPEIVKERKDGYLAVKYEQLVPVLIEGMKEQQKQIDELKQKLEEL